MNTAELLSGMRRVRRVYELRLAPVLERHGLTRFEADVMAFLHNNPGMDAANHIVEYRMIPKANVSKAVDGLERRGLLTHRRDENDRRRIHLRLTEAAAPILRDVLAAQEDFHKTVTAGFTREELDLFDGFFKRIADNAIDRTE